MKLSWLLNLHSRSCDARVHFFSHQAPPPPLLAFPSLQLLGFFNAKLAAQTLDASKLSQICADLNIPAASCPNNTISQLSLIT